MREETNTYHIYMCIYIERERENIYIYIYGEREREREMYVYCLVQGGGLLGLVLDVRLVALDVEPVFML